MTRSFLVAAMALVMGLGADSAALARGAGDPPATPPAKPADKPAVAAKPAEAPKKDEKTTDYERAVKDLTRVPGPFPMYVRKKEVLMEVPETALGKPFLVQATLASGANSMGLQAGDPINGIDVFS